MSPETMPLPKAKEGTVGWQIFLSTKEKEKKITYPDGSYAFEVTPIFADTIKVLEGKRIKLHGFMFPLEQAQKQGNFLLGPYPPSCPFHYHVPPALMIEVKARKPVAFSWDELTMEGTLTLLAKAPNGVYYELTDAVVVK